MFFKDSLNNSLTHDEEDLGPVDCTSKHFGFTVKSRRKKDEVRLELCSFKLSWSTFVWSLIAFCFVVIANQFYKSHLLDYSLKEQA